MSHDNFSLNDLKRFLEAANVEVRFFRFEEHTMTVDAAARQVGVSRERIIKSILFIGNDGAPILAIVTGDKRVDERKLARASGVEKVRRATRSEVKYFTGYNVGAVPPVGHKMKIKTIIDKKVLNFDKVIGGGGEINTLMEISPLDIKKLTEAEIRDIGDE